MRLPKHVCAPLVRDAALCSQTLGRGAEASIVKEIDFIDVGDAITSGIGALVGQVDVSVDKNDSVVLRAWASSLPITEVKNVEKFFGHELYCNVTFLWITYLARW